MEKFLWNAGGVLLFLAETCFLLFCFVEQSAPWCICAIATGLIGFLYIRKRPTWIEV